VESRVRFESLYQAHGGAVRTFVGRRMSSSVADDVVSDVFVIAWRRLEEAPVDERAWLFGIARGVMANRRRGDARRQALHDRLVATTVVEVEPGLERPTGGSALLRALGCLNERDQELLRLVAWDGLDRARAAQVLGISTSLVSLRLHRARRRLARALAAEGIEERRADDPSSLEVL
jgi:RNA polymerase sigma-70 factor (ECF subfamily)